VSCLPSAHLLVFDIFLGLSVVVAKMLISPEFEEKALQQLLP
jgi:hypothetical protein